MTGRRASRRRAGPLGAPAPEGLAIRRARFEDLERIVEVEEASFSTPWSVASFYTILDRRDFLFLVAEGTAPGRTVGLVGYAIMRWAADQAELANLAVAPEARGSGIGHILLDRVLAEARLAGVREVFLEVRMSNHAALALYHGRGFHQVGVREQYYERPREDARVLRLDLTGQTP